MVMKRGFFFSVDALIALFIVALAVISVSYMHIDEKPNKQLYYVSDDIISVMATTQIDEINNTYAKELIEQGKIEDNSSSILETIGFLWSIGKNETANALAKNITASLTPKDYGISFVIDGDVLYTNGVPVGRDLISHKSLVTGIEEDRPLTGISSRIYLTSVGEHEREEFVFFGGFVGQGNITRFFEEIPEDARINFMEMEFAAEEDFRLYINEQECGEFNPTEEPMRADRWNITNCKDLITKGTRNNITINFLGEDIANHFISGGYISMRFATDEIASEEEGTGRFYFPGIDGMVNLYSSLYLPSNLESMDINLHFKSNHTTSLIIGNETVLNMSTNGTREEVSITDDELQDQLDYDFLSDSNVPLRFYSFNLTEREIFEGGNADVVLLTDMTRSMATTIDEWDGSSGQAIPQCREEDISEDNVRKRELARCLNLEINRIIMNETADINNLLWLSDFREKAFDYFSSDIDELTEENIEEEIEDRYAVNYGQYPGTGPHEDQSCLSCTLNQAYDILSTYSEEDRQRHVILVTDGLATDCAGSYIDEYGVERCNVTSTGTESEWSGYESPGFDCQSEKENCDIEWGEETLDNDCYWPAKNAINAAERLYKDLNVTVNAVGMGPLEDCDMANYTLSGIADKANGTVLLSQNATEVFLHYRELGKKILEGANLTRQRLEVEGNLTPSVIYDDSFIEYNYEPDVEGAQHGEFPINLQFRDFENCTAKADIPHGVRTTETRITSYSDDYWTHFLTLDNPMLTTETTIFNLTEFSTNFSMLGDPYSINIHPDLIDVGEENTFNLGVGSRPGNTTSCSPDNSIIYEGMINIVNATTPYSSVLPRADGCTWEIETFTEEVTSVNVPSYYTGERKCYYTNSTIEYDKDDSYDNAMYELLNYMDYNNDGRIFLNFEEDDLEINVRSIDQMPYLLGPAVTEVRVWK